MTDERSDRGFRVTDNLSSGSSVFFPTELVTTLVHVNGLLDATMVPLTNLPAFAAHPDPECRRAGELVAAARARLQDVLHKGPYACTACLRNIVNSKRMVAVVFVRLATKPKATMIQALCKNCGANQAAMRRGLINQAHEHGERLAQSPHLHMAGGQA